MDIPCDFSHIFPATKPFRRAPPAPFCTPLTCSSPCQAASRFAMAASSAVVPCKAIDSPVWKASGPPCFPYWFAQPECSILRCKGGDSSVTPPNQTLTTRKIYRPEKHLIGDWSFQMFFKGSIITSSISSSTFTHFNSFHPVSSNFPLDHSWFHQTSSPVPPAMCFHSHATFHRGAIAGCGCDRCDRDRCDCSGVLLEQWQLAGVLHRAAAVLEQCSQTAASWHFCIEMTKISGVMYYKDIWFKKKMTNSDYPKSTPVDFIAFYSWVL